MSSLMLDFGAADGTARAYRDLVRATDDAVGVLGLEVAAGAVGVSKSDLRAMLDGRNGRRLPTDVAAVIARRVGAGVYRDRIIKAIRELFDIADPPENDRDYVHRLEGAMLRFGALGEAELAKCRREARRS